MDQALAVIALVALLVVVIRDGLLLWQQTRVTATIAGLLAQQAGGAKTAIVNSAPVKPATTTAPPTTPQAVIDQGLVDAVKKFEGFSAKAYGDYKQYSIGYGTRAASASEVITEAEAEKRLQQELAIAAASVEQFAPNAPVGVKQALTDLTYNAGPIWEKQTLGTLIKAGSYEEAKSHVLQYNHAGGEVLDALTKRRQAEVSWFDHPL